MRKQLLLLLALFSFSALLAQEELNPKVKIYNGSVEYQSPTKSSKLLGIASAFLGPDKAELKVEDKSLVEGITAAIHDAAVHHYRLIVQQGEAPTTLTQDECYRLDARLWDVMSGNGQYAIADAKMELILVNTQTGMEVSRHQFSCGSLRDSYGTKAEAIASLNEEVNVMTLYFLLANFPLTGSILQKGVEQANGKVKEKQCYIDLGDKFNVMEGFDFAVYADNNGKQEQIGMLELTDTEGDDVGVCKIKKGNKKIEKALAAGQHLTIKIDAVLSK